MSNTDNATAEHESASFGDQYPFILSFDSPETAKSKLDLVLSALIDSHLAIYPEDFDTEEEGCPAVRFNVPVLIEDDTAEGVKATHTLLPELLAETSRLALERGFIVHSVKPTVYSIADVIESGSEINQETYGFGRCAGWSIVLARWSGLENEALRLDEDGDPIYAFWWTRLSAEEAHEQAQVIIARRVLRQRLGNLKT